jgi:hypothetical protein
MIQQTLRAFSESKLLAELARLQSLGWSTVGLVYKEGLYWYGTVRK